MFLQKAKNNVCFAPYLNAIALNRSTVHVDRNVPHHDC